MKLWKLGGVRSKTAVPAVDAATRQERIFSRQERIFLIVLLIPVLLVPIVHYIHPGKTEPLARGHRGTTLIEHPAVHALTSTVSTIAPIVIDVAVGAILFPLATRVASPLLSRALALLHRLIPPRVTSAVVQLPATMKAAITQTRVSAAVDTATAAKTKAAAKVLAGGAAVEAAARVVTASKLPVASAASSAAGGPMATKAVGGMAALTTLATKATATSAARAAAVARSTASNAANAATQAAAAVTAATAASATRAVAATQAAAAATKATATRAASAVVGGGQAAGRAVQGNAKALTKLNAEVSAEIKADTSAALSRG